MNAEWQGPLLRSVARSFYLSIRLLPGKLRAPIALAYLLARATDTIADTVTIDAPVRLDSLGKLAALIQGEPVAEAENFLATFTAQQTRIAERALIAAVPACLRWLEAMPQADRADIREVLAKISQGQRLDVERFANCAPIVALTNGAELDRYTYLVAGCVGEFWTRVCFRHLTNFATRSPSEMLSLGENFGRGLQLVNILRDAGEDLRAGRCYLPADELPLEPKQLLVDATPAEPVVKIWRERAEQGIADGLEYACAIRSWRVRLATALPALIGARTLALLREAGARAFVERVKVPRAEVRQIIFRAVRTLASRRALRAAFARLST